MKRLLLIILLVASASAVRADVIARRVTVTSAATRLDANTTSERILVLNQGTASVFLGASNVTTATGLEIAPQTSLSMTLGRSETLYGIVASVSQRVDVVENQP